MPDEIGRQHDHVGLVRTHPLGQRAGSDQPAANEFAAWMLWAFAVDRTLMVSAVRARRSAPNLMPAYFDLQPAIAACRATPAGSLVLLVRRPKPTGELDRMSANKAANLSLIAHAEPEPTLSRLRGGLALIGLFQRGDVELDHLHHRLNSPLGAGGIGTAQMLHQRGRHDLPRYAVTVLQPAATFDRPAIGGQPVPQAIDLSLIGAVDLERDRMGIFEAPAAVERHEALAGQRELHHQHGAGLSGGAIDCILLDLFDPGIRQQRNVEFRGLLGLAVEPQAG